MPGSMIFRVYTKASKSPTATLKVGASFQESTVKGQGFAALPGPSLRRALKGFRIQERHGWGFTLAAMLMDQNNQKSSLAVADTNCSCKEQSKSENVSCH